MQLQQQFQSQLQQRHQQHYLQLPSGDSDEVVQDVVKIFSLGHAKQRQIILEQSADTESLRAEVLENRTLLIAMAERLDSIDKSIATSNAAKPPSQANRQPS